MGNRKMCKVTIEEFDKNRDKYFELAKTEEVEVFKKDSLFFRIDKNTIKRYKKFKKFLKEFPCGLKIDPRDRR